MSDELHYAIGTVFHPTDFSGSSRSAFEHALRIALANRSALDVIHSGAVPSRHDWPGVAPTLARWGHLDAGVRESAIQDVLGVTVNFVQVEGPDTAAGIAHYLGERQSGLLVMAIGADEGLPSPLSSSVAERIALKAMPESLERGAMVAALFVPGGAGGFVSPDTGAIDLERVLVPVDRSPDPQPAIDTAGAFLQSLNAEPIWIEAFHAGSEGSGPHTFAPAGMEECFMRATRLGEPVDEIIAAAERGQSDLIVMATAGRSGFLDALRGSTAEQVVRRAPCPVLTVPVAA